MGIGVEEEEEVLAPSRRVVGELSCRDPNAAVVVQVLPLAGVEGK